MEKQICSPEPTTLGRRASHLANAVQNRLAEIERASPTVKELLLDTVHERLALIPVDDFDATRTELAAFIKKNGCQEVDVDFDRLRLSDLLEHMRTTDLMLEPYRAALARLKGNAK